MEYIYRAEIQLRRDNYWHDDIKETIHSDSVLTAKQVIKQALESNYFTNVGEYDAIYIDKINGDTEQVGTICKASTDIDGKRVRFEAWGTVYQLNLLV